MWSPATWQLPTAYIGPYKGPSKSDVLLHLAFIRAARDGHFIPFCPKIVPELGAPYDGNWNDWPIIEEFPIYGVGLLARCVGIFAALNVALLTCHLLSGLAFYFVARYRKIDIVWAFTSALTFGLASYIFSQSPDHPLVALCWHIPLFLLVWDWVSSESGVGPGSKRFWFGIVVGLLAGLQMPYYAGVFCQLVLLGAIAMFIRMRRLPQLISALCFVAATALAFALMNIDTWAYRFRFGPNPGALVREYQWLEIYGLKLIDLVVPPIMHHLEVFRNVAQWRTHTAILHDEGSYFGIIGVAALSILVARAIRPLIKRGSFQFPREAWQVLWIFLFFTTGGLNAIVGLSGFTYFRAGCRFSIVILAISLLFAAEWLTRRRNRPVFSGLAACACCLVVLLDQVPARPSAEEKESVTRQISSDQKFVADMELVLQHGAMVFQLPVMDFPESPLRTESSYDHLRPYLYTHYLRFSFGSMKGRPREQWQHEVVNMSLPDAIAEIKKRGFSALYISRIGYPDGAYELEQNLRTLGYNEVIHSAEGDLFCVRLDSKTF